jgi:hypothetical protein
LKEEKMKLLEYINVEEVRKVCKALKLRDWSKMKEAKVLPKEARVILSQIDTKGMNIDLEEFRKGLEVELEHGTRFKEANVTNNHPMLTGKIVLAHLKESLNYYKLLEVAELEGDLLKAILAKNMAKTKNVYKKLAKAKVDLSKAESEQL